MPNDAQDDCTIPHPVDAEALRRYNLRGTPYDGADHVREYVEDQSHDETVTYLERMSVERVIGRDIEIWDVHTSASRYWVLTNPTNLYEQRLFPSADYTMTFHVGLMARIEARRKARATEEEKDRLAAAWRLWQQALDAMQSAVEAEDFQAVGMRCRECLLALVAGLAVESMVPQGSVPPKMGDFLHWSEHLANALASGGHHKDIRGYLKSIARETWQLAAWLTHAAGATAMDAKMTLDATESVLVAFGTATLSFEEGVPARCPRCRSYKIAQHFVGDISATQEYASLCESCGWNNARSDRDPDDSSDGEQPGTAMTT